MNGIVSLRSYINTQVNSKASSKVETFCRLMKKVSEKIEKETRNIIKINLDEIGINISTGEIVLPDNLFSSDLDKTIANFNTGVSILADRKSTEQNKRVAFALMVLGWYVDPNGSSISSDMDVIEHFEEYISKVPSWLTDYFINIFKKMDYSSSFNDYYKNEFINKTKNNIKNSFSSYNLNNTQLDKIISLVLKEAVRMTEEVGTHA